MVITYELPLVSLYLASKEPNIKCNFCVIFKAIWSTNSPGLLKAFFFKNLFLSLVGHLLAY